MRLFVDRIKFLIISIALLILFSIFTAIPIYAVLYFLGEASILKAFVYGMLGFSGVGWVIAHSDKMFSQHKKRLGIEE